MGALRVAVFLILVFSVTSYRYFQDELPNGNMVQHPCKPNVYWRGLGHDNPLGGGPRNSFGRDFQRYNLTWTRELCNQDSDGDGQTNGQELGDPGCTWEKGQFPSRTTDITHPGVCTPLDSPRCAGTQVNCETGEFECDGLDAPDVFSISLRFPPTPVPAKETSYFCYTFDLDVLDPNTDYHLIATEPIIDNPNVMHHMGLTGCNAASMSMDKPALCNMAEANCQTSIGLWTLGMTGECFYKEAGFKIGPKAGISRLSLQHHWTNPELRTDYMDSSGMKLYLTTNLRPYNAGYFATGEQALVIPPGSDRVTVKSTCTSRCSKKIMKGDIHLMTGLNHMHYLGYQQNVEHFRDGSKLRDLTPDEQYSYDNPIVHEYNPPVVMRPGDELETTCVFRSLTRQTTTYFGEGTFDEMCYGIFTYFPVENFTIPICVTHGELEMCDFEPGYSGILGCDVMMLFNTSHPVRKELFSKIKDNCNSFGSCRQECPAAIAEVRRNPCFSSTKLSRYAEDTMTFAGESADVLQFLGGLHSCECPTNIDDMDDHTWVYPSSAMTTTITSSLILVSTMFSVLNF